MQPSNDKFLNLLMNSSRQDDVGKQQQIAMESLPLLVNESGFRYWTPNSPISNSSRVLLGVASYSLPDLRLLDIICDKYKMSEQIQLDIFDVASIERVDLDKYFPSVRSNEIVCTPLAGWWPAGGPLEFQQGFHAYELVINVLSLEMEVSELHKTG